MSALRYLQETQRSLRATTQAAMKEALVSVAQTTLLLCVGGFLTGMTLGAMRAQSPPPKLVTWTTLTLGLSLVGGGMIRSVDAIADVDHAAHLNSAATRNRATEATFQASLTYLTKPDYVTGYHMGSVEHVRAELERLYTGPARYTEDAYPVRLPPTDSRAHEHTPPNVGTVEVSPVDVADLLGSTVRSTIIVGQPGAGKGRMTKHALEAVRRHHPTCHIWVIDPKQDPDEADQWKSADQVTCTELPAFPTPHEVDEFKAEVMGFLEEFKALPGPKLLVLDEAMSVKEVTGAWFSTLMAGFNSLCSKGRSRQHWGWVISQSPNTTDLGLSGGARNVYTRVLLVHAQDQGLLTNKSTFFAGTPDPQLFHGPSARVAYMSTNNLWCPIPVYT